MSEENGPSREALRAHRQIFWDAWHKAQADLPINALEVRIARVIEMHPEHHHFLDDMEDFLERDFQVDYGINTFMHVFLPLAVKQQFSTTQPKVASNLMVHLLTVKKMDRHDALHKLLEILAETVYFAQRAGREPDVEAYARRMKELVL